MKTTMKIINMKRKNIILTESQLQRLTEIRIQEYTANEIVNILSSIDCTGESVKTLVSRKLSELGFEEITIKFLGYGGISDELKYIVYTEGPVFVFTAKSKSNVNPPCMDIVDVVSYTKN